MAESTKPEPVNTNTRQSKQAFWNHHIDTWYKSGLTQVQYCLENQLNKHTFTYWKSKLEKQRKLFQESNDFNYSKDTSGQEFVKEEE